MRSYTIMSSPSLLEYHLLSSRPFDGLLLKRLPISLFRSRVPHGTRITPNSFFSEIIQPC